MLKPAALASFVLVLASIQASAELACPVVLTDARADGNLIRLAVRNNGKSPIEEVSFSCSPAPRQHAGIACHTASGLFYPGTPYWFTVPYVGADHHTITVGIRGVRLAGGETWTP